MGFFALTRGDLKRMDKSKLSLAKLILAVIVFISLGIVLGTGVYLMKSKPKVNPSVPPGNELKFETLLKGSYSEISERKNSVITSQAEWIQVLQKTGAELPAPIDFAKDMIIAAFQGVYPTGGYSIEITKILENENNLEAFVKETYPGKNCAVTQAFTSPYHIVKLQRSNKEVVFNVEKEVRMCK